MFASKIAKFLFLSSFEQKRADELNDTLQSGRLGCNRIHRPMPEY